mmetsp:Transcript_53308/g.106014  ORF Transcript_53308/g.106014 Transcript_53308/m.106014 type:complete len:1062 (-) Transcript_53308:275-3460(-)
MPGSSCSSRSSSRRRFTPLHREAVPERAGKRRQRPNKKGLEQAVLSALQYDSSSSDDIERRSVKKSLLAELTASRETAIDAAGDDSVRSLFQTSDQGLQKGKVRRRKGTGADEGRKQAKSVAASRNLQEEGAGRSGSMDLNKVRSKQEKTKLNDSHEHNGDDGPRPGRGARYVRKGRGMKSRVVQDPDHASTKQPGGDAGVSSGSEDGRRVRIKGNGLLGNASKAGMQKDKEVSESEFEPTTEEIQNWRSTLNKHMDSGNDDLRTAFSIKECNPSVIRRLGPESFLSGHKLEEGGLPLYDDDGKANLHFLLGTYLSIRRTQSKRARGDNTVEAVPDAQRGLIRWLLLQARQLQLISQSELKRYKVERKRVDAMKKSRQYSLALKANWATASGDELQDTPEKKAAHEMDDFDARFPERRSERQVGSSTALQERLRTQAVSRQSGITVQSSRTVDMQKVKDALLAPKMSFDWEAKVDDEEEDAWGGLEVEVPEEQAVSSSRDMFKDQMRRSVSFHQAKSLRMNDCHLGQRRTQSASDLTTSLSDSADAILGDASLGSTSALRTTADAADESGSIIEGTAHGNEAVSPITSVANTADQRDFMSVDSAVVSADNTSCKAAKHETPVQQAGAVASSAASSVSSNADACTSGVVLASERPGPLILSSALPSTASSSSPATTEPVITTEVLKSSLPTPEVPAIQTKSVLIGRRGLQATPPGVKVSMVTLSEVPNNGATDGEAPILSESARSGPASITHVGETVLLAAAQVKAATHSQDWISPTAMWGGSPWTPCSSPNPVAGTNTPRAGPGDRMPGEALEISPTVPFVPLEEAKGETFTGLENLQAGINGAVQQEQGHAEKANSGSFEISPTVPFVPTEEANVAGALEGLPARSNHVTVEEDGHDLKAHDRKLESSVPDATRPRLERVESDSLVSLNGDVSDEPVDADQIAEPEEASSQRDEKRRRMEREWLRHKRQTLLQQEERTRRRKVRQTLAESTDRLRVASMNKEDQGRYDSVIAEPIAKKLRTAVLGFGMTAPADGEVDDDSSLLGGFANSGQRRPRILLGR